MKTSSEILTEIEMWYDKMEMLHDTLEATELEIDLTMDKIRHLNKELE